MINLNVKLPCGSYPVYISDSYNFIYECFVNIDKSSKLIVITDTNVDRYHGEGLMSVLRSGGYEAYKYVLKSGEKSKSLDTVENIYRFLSDLNADRGDVLIALGGGVTGDITGFVAATYLRGIMFIQIPTSLLAQVDSSIGGKTGVNFNGIKNIVGAFYQPCFVFINIDSLKTLPIREMRSGLAEVIVHCIIGNPGLLNYISDNFPKRIGKVVKCTINDSKLIKTVLPNWAKRQNSLKSSFNGRC